MRSPDEPETTELLSEHQRVGPGESATSRRPRAVCAKMLLYVATVEQRSNGGGVVVEGRWAGGRASAGGEPLRAGPLGLGGGMGERGPSPELLRGSG